MHISVRPTALKGIWECKTKCKSLNSVWNNRKVNKWNSAWAHEVVGEVIVLPIGIYVCICVWVCKICKVCGCICDFRYFRHASAWRKYSNEHKIVVFKHNKYDSNNNNNCKCAYMYMFDVNYAFYVQFLHRNIRRNAKIYISNSKFLFVSIK